MKLRGLTLGLVLWLCPATYATSALTVISDTITSPNGSHPSGTITISWGRYQNDAVPRQVIFPGSQVLNVTNGVISVSLFPNAAALPVGGCYSVAYRLGSLNNSTRYWYVPVSATPVNLNTVEGSLPCPTQSGVLISPGQIAVGNATVGQVLAFNGYYWAPATGGSGTGTPGGTNGQLQYNSLGAFGGFTLGGDCTLNRPNLTCTKTNGVSFAPSATTDTTNAGNISAGTLGTARGGTGTGTFTLGSIVYAGASGIYSQDNTNLFYDSSNHRLGIGVGVSLQAALDVAAAGNDLSSPGVRVRASDAGTNGGYLILNKNSGANSYGLMQVGDGAGFQELRLNTSGGKVLIGSTPLQILSSSGAVIVGGQSDAGFRFDVGNSGSSGTARFYDQTATTGATSLQVRAGAGQGITEMLRFLDNTGAAMSTYGADGSFAAIGGGVRTALIYTNVFGLGSAGRLSFNNQAGWDGGTVDVSLARTGINALEIDTGTLGVFADLKLANLTSSVLAGTGNQCVSVDNTGKFVIAGTGACFAGSTILTPYSASVSSQTSVTILAVTHGRGTTPVATCLDNSTPKVVVSCSYTRNTSGDLVFAFNPSFSGTLEVRP